MVDSVWWLEARNRLFFWCLKMLSQGISYRRIPYSLIEFQKWFIQSQSRWNGSEFHILSPHINENDVQNLIITLFRRQPIFWRIITAHSMRANTRCYMENFDSFSSLCNTQSFLEIQSVERALIHINQISRRFVKVNKLKTIFFRFQGNNSFAQRTNYAILYYVWRIFTIDFLSFMKTILLLRFHDKMLQFYWLKNWKRLCRNSLNLSFK